MKDREWCKMIEDEINGLKERMKKLEVGSGCRCRQQTPKTVELEIEWHEADISGLHFNFQRTKGVFELKEDGWYHSRDILFMSARNTTNDNSQDTLLAYLKNGVVNEAFCYALIKAGVTGKGVKISLPKDGKGPKKYNGIWDEYWLLPRYPNSNCNFYYVLHAGSLHGKDSCFTAGCAPVFRVG